MASGVPDRASNLSWARQEPVRSIRFLIQRGLMMPFTEVMTHPKVEGSEWVTDLERPALLVSNHVSHADTPLLLHALSDRVRERTAVAAAADYFYKRPWLGRVVSLWLNTFPFARTGGAQEVLHSSSELLRSGWNLLVYPEGTRSPDGRLGDFKPGIGHLAKETRAPVIPMHVRGSHRVMPKGQKLPLPAPVTIRIGRPLEPGKDEPSRDFAARVEGAVRELAAGSEDPAVVGTWIDRWRATGRHQAT
jgi:1-acyl-sn-glycerol-3-phosphate acyltransferase